MLNGKSILVVVPARGGSKGVIHKNIHPLLGRPLVAHTAELIKELPWIDRAVVSTDDEVIAKVCEMHGLAAPFRRPVALAGDRIGDWEVLQHALLEMDRLDAKHYDVVLMLQPTSPLRRPEHVQAATEKLLAGRWDAVWTVSPTDLKYHPLKALAISMEGAMGYFDERGAHIIARQQLQPIYHRNGAAYAMTRDCLLGHKSIVGPHWTAVVVEEQMVSIDTLEDFARVESALRARRA